MEDPTNTPLEASEAYVDPDLQQVTRQDRAFATADAERSIFGSPLRAFSGRLLLAAQSIGLRLFGLSQDQLSKLSVDDESSMYDGLFLDAAIITWLRLQNNKDVVRATLNRNWAVEQVLAWADKHDISITNEAGKAMLEGFVEAVTTIAESSGGGDNSKK